MRPHHRGSIRGGQFWEAPSRTSGGSMTEQDLEDIDKELMLLRRKREIIKQQNELLTPDFGGRNDYEESYNQGSRFSNYAAPSYTERRDYNNAPSRKRPIPVWESDLPSKRFSGAPRPRSSSRPPPLMQAPFCAPYQPRPQLRPKSGTYKPKPPKKDPPPKLQPKVQTKVQTKPAPAPNKLATYPVAERKKLIASAIDLSSDVSESNRLCLDREPSKQLIGRLELALGSIFKDIKANADPNMIKSVNVTREIKTVLRDRIRGLMMNKIVGSADTIKAQYRKVYDIQSDIGVVISTLDTQAGEFTLFQTDDPEKYFKVNMNKLMHNKLKKLFEKLEETCRAEMMYLGVITPGGASGGKNPGKGSGLNIPGKASDVNIPGKASDVNIPGKASDVNIPGKVSDVNIPGKASDVNIPGKASDVNIPGGISDAEKDPDNITSTEKLRGLDKWMSIKMAATIKKYIPCITKLMDMDTKYRRQRNMITSETVKMLKQGSQKIDLIPDSQKVDVHVDFAGESKVSVADTKSPSERSEEYKPLPYFAKLMGRPALPKRNQMQQFFTQFNPKSIKKHRTVHNLLFVGFTDKDKYDMFLAADGTAIGKYVLSIRVSERSATEPVKDEFDASNTSVDKLIGEELDEQITDLLTSIRKAEEDEQGEDAAQTVVKMECDSENAEVPKGDDENAGETDVQTEDITAKSENNVGGADENITENAEENITENTDENITKHTDENITENADESITENTDENITENADENITENADENITENADENITENADENITENTDKNNAEPENTDENITKNTDKNNAEPENTDENITKNTDENSAVPENTDENITKNTDENNAQPETADKEATDIPAKEKNSCEPIPEDNGPAPAAGCAGKGTPARARASARLARPATPAAPAALAPARVQTRRASRLAHHDA